MSTATGKERVRYRRTRTQRSAELGALLRKYQPADDDAATVWRRHLVEQALAGANGRRKPKGPRRQQVSTLQQALRNVLAGGSASHPNIDLLWDALVLTTPGTPVAELAEQAAPPAPAKPAKPTYLFVPAEPPTQHMASAMLASLRAVARRIRRCFGPRPTSARLRIVADELLQLATECEALAAKLEQDEA